MDQQFEFQQLFPDLKWEIVMKMNDRELVNLCRSSNAMENFCNTREWFWKARIQSLFNIDPADPTVQGMLNNNGGNWFRVYFILVRLNKLKQKLSPHLDRYNLIDLYNLQTLSLSQNQLSELPREIGDLTNLKKLVLINNRLSDLPTQISNLTNLKYLTLCCNQLSDQEQNRTKQLLPNTNIYF